jgi:Flp pilus assembly protein TadD
MTDEQFARARDEKLAMCHSALGLADLDQNKAVEATQEFTEALKLEATPDPVDQYLLGMTLMQQNQFAPAQTAFESCAKPGTAMSERCKQQADTAKKQAAAKPH